MFTLPQTAQLEALYTIIRDKETSQYIMSSMQHVLFSTIATIACISPLQRTDGEGICSYAAIYTGRRALHQQTSASPGAM
ncbi:hypothetical protein BD310DRAFT_137066 [Dichomitus squalens]|uniref:Uncharacterized protein n=1 Tax=Dichomitus squalens TaxID=114155 RepID=A0A4Q9PGK7_9APHY|nr:hypothetical protein BD310DRAFT_137066 [Dichomitus squalens]